MCQNVGVLIDNGEVYYPGDSFAEPGMPVKTLALPIAAPWMKTSEAMDFLTHVKPERAFPTHDAILSTPAAGFEQNKRGALAYGRRRRTRSMPCCRPVASICSTLSPTTVNIVPSVPERSSGRRKASGSMSRRPTAEMTKMMW